ncbi:hypothetical protein B9Z19DRAFT_1077658 [Tuber borchii]|uniref:Uncharacterized protein n=1 Tax=Tuber borchii TaxID=42251 RepID=A0A2T7A0I0_TUBBO|nr:hypothetical protein B9Z19DRAFT_1077658 [Tuber borchii]
MSSGLVSESIREVDEKIFLNTLYFCLPTGAMHCPRLSLSSLFVPGLFYRNCPAVRTECWCKYRRVFPEEKGVGEGANERDCVSETSDEEIVISNRWGCSFLWVVVVCAVNKVYYPGNCYGSRIIITIALSSIQRSNVDF